MPVTRRNKISSEEDFLSLSMVKKSKPSKRPMEEANDSINVAKRQKRCKLRYGAGQDQGVGHIVANPVPLNEKRIQRKTSQKQGLVVP